MTKNRNRNELERTLERQLATCLDRQLSTSPVYEERSLGFGSTNLDDVLDHIEVANSQLISVRSKIRQEKKIARKYVELCSLVKGLLRNFRKLAGENEAKAARISKLENDLHDRDKQLLESRELITTLQHELIKSMDQVEADRRRLQFSRAQVAQLMQLMRISKASQVDFDEDQPQAATTTQYKTINQDRSPESCEEIRPVKRITHTADSDKESRMELLERIDEMLAQMPGRHGSDGKIAA